MEDKGKIKERNMVQAKGRRKNEKGNKKACVQKYAIKNVSNVKSVTVRSLHRTEKKPALKYGQRHRMYKLKETKL